MKRRTTKRVELFETPMCRALVARFAANIRRLREGKGWSQEECAFQSLQLDAAMLRTIEAGQANLTITTIARLCQGLGVDVLDLFQPSAPLQKRRPGRPPKQPKTEPESAPTATVEAPPERVPHSK